ncbi:MAG TPA: CAP domain-containing protein [Acidimicrobiia bacterium]|nr:CAP domain-containing protein [Acidimicrobiia bacterium]
MGRTVPTESRWLPALFAGLLAVSLIAVAPPRTAQAAPSLDSFEACLLDGVNDARAAAGRAPVQMAYDIVDDVREWSEWMRFNEFKHMPSSLRNQILPSSWTTWAENIAMHGNSALPDCDAIHQMWMNSDGHRRNILNSSMRFVAIGTYHDSSGWWATQLFFDADGYSPACNTNCDDEMFFYRSADGAFRYYKTQPSGSLGTLLQSGTGYSTGWDTITGLDLDGDHRDESLFYRSSDGAFRYYETEPDGSLGNLLQGGTGYSSGWDSISAIDLDGDNKDELFFYRSSDGAFRYYDVRSDGLLGGPLYGGTGYSLGWDSISAIDLDGDNKDELFFYRSSDGAYRYYDMKPDGRLGALLQGGTGYSIGWDSISAVDLDGDNKDELFFYRSGDGAYRYYDMKPDGRLGALLQGGTGYSIGWDSITAMALD